MRSIDREFDHPQPQRHSTHHRRSHSQGRRWKQRFDKALIYGKYPASYLAQTAKGERHLIVAQEAATTVATIAATEATVAMALVRGGQLVVWMARGSGAITRTEAIVESGKLGYLLGRASGRAHNVERALQNARQLSRVGVHDTAAGRALLESHLKAVAGAQQNVTRTSRINMVISDKGIFILRTRRIFEDGVNMAGNRQRYTALDHSYPVRRLRHE